ncbi:MAG: enoyl-CoA hydratase/isomerase family protein [Promethearchaeota archaeon]
MEYKDYKLLKIKIDQCVAFITIDNPPMNLLNFELFTELGRFMTGAESDKEIKVLVFDSADPDFFISHFDVSLLINTDIFPEKAPPRPTEPDDTKKLMMRYRSLPKVTIAKVEGIVGGGGSETILGFDMRFGSKEKAYFYQPEGILGIVPGGGGTQRLTRLMGKARALEALLGCNRFNAELAERYGWINRAIPQAELTKFVNELAYKIALIPSEAIGLMKKAVVAAEDLSTTEGYIEESYLFNKSLTIPESRRRMKEYINTGCQSRKVETNSEEQIKKLKEIIQKSDV